LDDRSHFRLMDMAILQELWIRECYDACGNRKPQALIAARCGQNKCVDSEELAIGIYERPPAIAWIYGGVCLNVDKRTIRIGLSLNCAHHAHGHRVTQALRTTEGKDQFALSGNGGGPDG